MTFKEFKNKVEERFNGYDIRFEKNEAQYAAVLEHALCFSNPWSEYVTVQMFGKVVGQF